MNNSINSVFNQNIITYGSATGKSESKKPGNEMEGKIVTPRNIFGEDDREDFYSIKNIDYDKYKSSLSIAKIYFKDGTTGTAWRLGPGNLMMTSENIISDRNIKDAKIEFSSYEHGCKESKYGSYCYEKVDKKVLNADKIVYSNNSDDEDVKLDYVLFSLEPKEFNSGELDKYSYLEIEPTPLKQGDKIYIPQYGLENEDGNEKFISISESYNFESADNESIYDGGDDGTIKSINGPFIVHHLDTTDLADGAPIISSETNKVVALNKGGDANSNIGVDMKNIFPKIKEVYDNSILEHEINNTFKTVA